MKMLPDQSDNYLIEASRLYKKYARAVFPLSAKKCKIFFGIFAHIFPSAKQRLIPVFFIFTSVKRRLISAFVFCQSPKNCRKYRICSMMTFFFDRLPNHRKNWFAAQHDDLFFLFGNRYFVASQSQN